MNKITAKIICDSINQNGNRLTTYELSYPRLIHSEFMTHRQFSRNAASSRAIPFDKMLEQLDGVPSRFGAAQKGMQDNGEEHEILVLCGHDARETWELAKQESIKFSRLFKEAGYHKQIYNRLTEPFQMIKAVVSATEYENFFWLRDDVMADPTIAELARKMKESYDSSTPQLLKAGEWHLPYVEWTTAIDDNSMYYKNSFDEWEFITTEQAIKVSAARCAAVSYRNEDYGLDKCLQLYERLVGDERKHSSALEHMATPIEEHWEASDDVHHQNGPHYPSTWEEGISHTDRDGNLWSGNFRGFIQHRKTIKGECYVRIN